MLSKFIKWSFVFVFILYYSFTVIAQQETNWSHFGYGAALNFNGGILTSASSNISTGEGSSAASDPITGDLLFYTDGITVFDRNNNVMPNGTNLLGNSSSSQSALVVPQPGSTSRYYIFTTDAIENAGIFGCNYSVVDMTLNNGFGDVIVAEKNILLFAPCGEQLTATKHANCEDWWIMTKEQANNTYRAYLLSSNGLSAPVISSIGLPSTTVSYGQSKFTPDGNKYAVSYGDIDFSTNPFTNKGQTFLFDFDNSTGVLSNFVSIVGIANQVDTYGISFSGDNSKLYVCRGIVAEEIWQYDLSLANPAAIVASGINIGNCIAYNQLQLAKDFKIYVSNSGMSTVSVIDSPNTAGMGCNFILGAVPLVFGFSSLGLCNFPYSYFNQTSPCNTLNINVQFNDTTCSVTGDAFAWVDIVGTPPFSIVWQLGNQTTDTIQNLVNNWYVVTVTDSLGNTDTDSVLVTELLPLTTNINSSADSVCLFNSVNLSAQVVSGGQAPYVLQWPNGSQQNNVILLVTEDTAIVVNYTDANNCAATDTISIIAKALPDASFNASFEGCVPLPVNLTAQNNNYNNYTWNLGDGNSIQGNPINYTYTTVGDFTITLVVNDNGCLDTFTVVSGASINSFAIAQFDFPPVTVTNTTVAFTNLSVNATSYLWNFENGDTSSVFEPVISYPSVKDTHTICLIATNSGNCSDTLCKTLVIEDEAVIYVPNAFTPNSGEPNNIFTAKGVNISNFEMRIFNRWGEEIFFSSDINKGWDGTVQNQEAKVDVYVYQIKYTNSLTETNELLRGHFTLIR